VWQRVHTFRHSEFVPGVVLNLNHNKPTFTGEVAMNLVYIADMKEYSLETYQYPKMENAIVIVRYLPEKPQKGEIYSLFLFWIVPILWLIVPSMIVCALILSFIDENSKVEFFISRKNKHQEQN